MWPTLPGLRHFVCALTAVAIVLSACVGPPAEPLVVGPLDPAHYRADDFAAPFTFTITAPGADWTAEWLTPHLVHLSSPELGSELGFYAVTEVYEDGQADSVIPAPASLVEWIEGLPNLDIAERERVQLGGATAWRLGIRVDRGAEVALIPPPDPDADEPQPYGEILAGSGSNDPRHDFIVWYVLEDVAGGPVVLTYYTDEIRFLGRMDDLLASLRFE
jgi:hypothetical protein